MANRRFQERPVGFKRKGPCRRAEDYDAMRKGLIDGEVERQCRRRQLVREREEATQLFVVHEEELEAEREMSSQEILVVLFEIVDFFTMKMQGCPEANSRLKIMERFLEDERVSPFLP